jgi:CelD/BcsL family acetyltransferase involved in cellulose biosynthesis
VSQGFEAYVDDMRRAGGRAVQNAESLARRLERDVGPLHFHAHTSDAGALSNLMKWKFERYRSHGYTDVFAIPWVRRLLHGIHETRTARFSGLLSVLYAGDELVAAHLGMRCLREWHYWYHAYNPRFARYSPGRALLLRVAQHAAGAGVDRIALGGCDEYGYKQQFMNSSIDVVEGTVGRIHALALAGRWRHAGATAIRQSSWLRPPARGVIRAYRRFRHGILY